MDRRTWTNTQLIEAVRNSISIADVLRELGLMVRPGNYITIWKYIRMLQLNTGHFKGQAHGTTNPKNKIPLGDILQEHSTYSNSHLGPRLIKSGFKENHCSICKTNTWQGKKIRLVLDHINGINNDNRLENLRLLCPNCNSQQLTFCRGQRRGRS
jgi:hypothetical protein